MPEEATPAHQIVEAEIRAKGPITFARFMEIALYGEHGYYTASVSAGADYATSPQTHPAFGALIAGYLFKAWQALGKPETFDVAELGAGDGGLARDILDAVANGRDRADQIGRFGEALRYHAFDIRPQGDVCSVDEIRRLKSLVGCVISNELLDAFPTHMFAIRNGAVWECYVGIDVDGQMSFVEDTVSNEEIEDRVGEYVSVLPEGYRGEVNLEIASWANSVVRLLQSGYVLTIDYGCERDTLYHPARHEGSLRCYRDHVLGQNPFRYVGLQDITAHADFTAVHEALNRVGIESMSELKSQRDFLFDLGIDRYLRRVRKALVSDRYGRHGGDWVHESRALNALVDIRGLGDFRVAQHRYRAPEIDLSELETAPIFPQPALSNRHLRHVPYD